MEGSNMLRAPKPSDGEELGPIEAPGQNGEIQDRAQLSLVQSEGGSLATLAATASELEAEREEIIDEWYDKEGFTD